MGKNAFLATLLLLLIVVDVSDASFFSNFRKLFDAVHNSHTPVISLSLSLSLSLFLSVFLVYKLQ
jgi:hypothetical protein